MMRIVYRRPAHADLREVLLDEVLVDGVPIGHVRRHSPRDWAPVYPSGSSSYCQPTRKRAADRLIRAELARLHSQAARPRARIALLTTIVERAA